MSEIQPGSIEEKKADEPGFRAGFVAIAGKPNVGKSTLMNRLVGAKLSAVSRRPQTTRDQIKGILTREDCQVVFVDTPGLIQPRDMFNEYLLDQAVQAIEDVDVLYHMVEACDPQPFGEEVAPIVERVRCVKFLVINKIDCLAGGREAEIPWLDQVAPRYDKVFRICALTGEGLSELLEQTVAQLPVHAPYYEEDYLTDRDERFLVAEIVREKLFELTGQEVPYSIATRVDEFKERPEGKHFIRVLIFVERESQKGLVVGAGGRLLKEVGKLARADIERLLNHPVYLELWVKVRKKWRKKEIEMRRLGYAVSSRKKRSPAAGRRA